VKPYWHYSIWQIGVSLLLLVAGFIVITESYSDVTESIAVIRNSEAIRSGPQALKDEIRDLERQKAELQSQVDRLENLQHPDLDLFSQIARENGIRLTGVNLRTGSPAKLTQGKEYLLVFTGRITSLLNALDNIENKILVAIESASLHANDANAELVDLNLLVRFPE